MNRDITESGCTRVVAESKFPLHPAPPSYVTPSPAPIPVLISRDNSYAAMARVASSCEPVSHNTQPCPETKPSSAMDALAANLCAITAIMNQMVEQNRTIINQNAEIIRLLNAPKVKQSTLAFTSIKSRGPATPRTSQSTPTPVPEVPQGGTKPKRMRSNDDQQTTVQLATNQLVTPQTVEVQSSVEHRPV